MTDATVSPAAFHGVASARRDISLWPTLLATLVGLLVISAPNLIDPMLRFDDYPALFADPSGFWHKTKDEGRWLSYLWHLREVTTPSWLNYFMYQVCWATIAASVGRLMFRTNENATWFAIVASLMIAVSPSALLMSLWFNTLLPGIALVALFAVIAHHVTVKTLRVLMVPFIVATFMSYTNYPLLILAIVVMRTEDRSIKDLAGLLTLFVVSFAIAVLTVYSINFYVHDVFGIPLADWREATPAGDLAGYLGNIPLLIDSLKNFAIFSTFYFEPAIYTHLCFLVAATVVLIKRAPLEALYLYALLGLALAMLAAQVLKMGLYVPPRANFVIWMMHALIVVRATYYISAEPGFMGRIARNFILLVVGSYGLQSGLQQMQYRDWQDETRAFATQVAAVEGPLVIVDDALQLASAQKAFVQDTRGLASRLKLLTGRDIAVCLDGKDCCPSTVPGPCPSEIWLKPSAQGPTLDIRPAS